MRMARESLPARRRDERREECAWASDTPPRADRLSGIVTETVYRHLALESQDEITIVRIDRPPANALDPVLLAESGQCLQELAADPPGAVVMTGREGFFSAGMDLKLAPTLRAEEQRGVVDGINRLFAGWYGFPRPVVCAVNGHAIAGGLILALCADYRIGSRSASARFGLTELRAGLPYPAVAMAVVRAELSASVTRRLVLRAHLFGCAQAAALGVLDELVDGDPLPRALELARELAALPATAYELIKGQLRAETIALATRVLEAGSDPLMSGWLGEDTAAAAASILESGSA
jgi:enoyl-CoA hydratase